MKVARIVKMSVTILCVKAGKYLSRAFKYILRFYRAVHHKYAQKPHHYMMAKSSRYAAWHSWRYKRIHHGHVHFAALAVYLLFVGALVFNYLGFVFAADLSNNWSFSNQGDYTIDSGVEYSGNAVRLKAQEYIADNNTTALYPFNESNGTIVDDISVNDNTATTTGNPSFTSGILNNGLNLNGTSQFASAPDSSSLSTTGQQSVEAWFKPNTTFNNTSSNNQTILDKGSYKLGLDGTSGKAFYEIENNNSQQWTKRMGDGQAGSWDFNHGSVETMVNYGNDVFAGIGTIRGDGEVWRWNGSTWSKIGGDGINSSWPDLTYESVTRLAVNGTALYAGLGTTSGDGEVWTCELSTNCTSWTKIGGDGTGIAAGTSSIGSMFVHNGVLYVGTNGGAGTGDLYRYNGSSSWTQIGGDGLNSGWGASAYETVASLSSNGTFLYAGLGTSTTDAEVWRWNGTSWTQIGGDGLNSSWNTNYETVESLQIIGSTLYAGLGTGASDAEVWRWNGTSWTQIGGDGLNSSWNNAIFTQVLDLANDGTNLYASLGSGTNSAYVYKYNGSTWTLMAGGGSTWTTTYSKSLLFANSTLYVGNSNTSGSPANIGSSVWQFKDNAWTTIGGHYLNNSWGGYLISSVSSSITHNGKMYVGVLGGDSNALVYEYDGTSATLIGGNSIRSSWPIWNYTGVTAMASFRGELYVGLSGGSTDGEVWKYNGSTWTQVGGDSLNSSWSENSVVGDMTVWNDSLYIVTQGAVGYSQVWQWNGTAWTRVDSGWSNFIYQGLALTVFNNQLCLGGGGSGSASAVYCWTGSGAWTLVGGRGTNGSWSQVTNGFVDLTVHDGYLYAAENNTNSDLTVWRWTGSGNWQQVGGGGINSSWSSLSYTSNTTAPMVSYNGELYLGTGGSATAGDVWRWNGDSWSKVAGSGVNNSWAISQNIEQVRTLNVYKGRLYAGLGSSSNADALVYSFGNNGYIESTTSSFSSSSWHHIAATYDGVNMKIFINGNQDASAPVSATGVDNSLPLIIGSGYGLNQSGGGSTYFNGQIDEVRISNIARSSFTTKPYANTSQAVTLSSAVRKSGVASWSGLTSDDAANGGTITYRLSDNDGSTWKYWSGSAWVESSGLSEANNISTVDEQINSFPVTFSGIRWQAILTGDGSQRVQLNSLTLTANSDTDPPGNASNIQAYKTNGGDEITSNSWTNAESPYFTWTAGSDSGAGILGYCLYLGTSSTADPATTKGLLGTNTVNNGGNCQFTIGTNSIDLATSGYLATELTTSNSPYYFTIKAIDNAGNLSSTSEQFQFRFDNTPPNNPGFITAPSQFVSSKEVTFSWPTSGNDAPSDSNSGLSGLQYRIGASSSWNGDGANGEGLLNNDGSYTTRENPDFANINEGNNTVYFRVWDQAGNVTTTYATAALRLNTSSPSGPQNIIASPTTNTSNSFAFSWSVPSTFQGSANNLTYCYTINTTPTANTCTFTPAGVTSLPAGAYATQPGENIFYVVAKDEAGNINYATASSASFTANTSAPGLPLDLDIADVSIKSTSSWRLALSWNTPSEVGAGVSSYRIFRSTDNINFSQVASTLGTSYVDAGLIQAKQYYKVRACDSANNCGAFSSVVSQTPTGKFTSPANITAQPTVSGLSTKKASIRWSTDRQSDSKISIGTKSGQYQPFQVASDAQVTDHRVELNNLTPGTTYFAKATWTDEDGNTGLSSEFSFKTEPAPSTQEVLTQRVTLNSAQIRFTSVAAAKVVIQFGKSDNFGGEKQISTSLSKSTYDIELSGLDDGIKYFYRLNTFDAEGNEYTGSTVLTFTTPARPRIENLRFQPLEGEPTSTQKISWRTNVPTTSVVRFNPKDLPSKEISNSELVTDHEVVVKGLLDNTEYTFVAESRDKDGNLAVSDAQSLRTALDTRPPKISDIQVETSIKGTGAEARGQVIVSWKTDEPATSQVAYADGSNATVFNKRTSEDTETGLEHIVIISDLPTSRVYSVRPISKDRSGNGGTGESRTAIIGRASDSVITIVLNTLRKVFGF